MAKLANRAWMSTATAGTGTITLASAQSGYQSFADAGITNGQTVAYTIVDGANWEVGTGTYTSAGTTLTRTVTESSNADAAISLSGSATVFITARPQDLGNVGEVNTWAAQQTFSAAINLTSGQIAFPASQSASANANTLDDYEEGTWTPTLTFATPGDLSVVYSARVGSYTKIGNLVRVNCVVVTSTFTHTTAAGGLLITGLPFASANVADNNHFGSGQWAGITKANYTDMEFRVLFNASQIDFTLSGSGQILAVVTSGEAPTAASINLSGTINYQSA